MTNNTDPLGYKSSAPELISVPCVVLGIGMIGAQAFAEQFHADNAAKTWTGQAAVPARGKTFTEGGSTQMNIATLKIDATGSLAANQDGGNGSGGDGASVYNADMLSSRGGLTFWKRVSGGVQTALGSPLSAAARGLIDHNVDPTFARFFPSHQDALRFLHDTADGKKTIKTFQHVLIVAVRVDPTHFPQTGTDTC